MLLARLENLRQHVPLDIATGDVITPRPIDYDYESIFDKTIIPVKAYPIETMIAEKIETIYSRGFLNSRSKDYFDLYLVWKLKNNKIDKETLKEAILNTFSYRNTEYDIEKLKNLITQLNKHSDFIKRWTAYKNKNNFVGTLEPEEILNAIFELLLLLES